MDTLPDKRIGSVIAEAVDPEGLTLSWPSQPARADWGLVAFLVFWLCGWAVCLVYAVQHLLNGEVQAFLIFWLGLWSVAGGLALRRLWAMKRPALPESVRLEADVLLYDSSSGDVIELARSDFKGFALERVGKRQRLRAHLGDCWLEIGASLQQPQREQLFAVLQAWYTSEPGPAADGGPAS